MALLLICAVQMMVILDGTIVNIALPAIQQQLHFSPASLEWVITAYALAFGGLLLLGGRSGDLFGRRRMFTIGVVLFTAASLLGGFATDQAWLIAARVLQGVGGAIASPTALALIQNTFPEGAQRSRAMGVYAAMSGAGGLAGPPAGRHPHRRGLVALGAVRQRAHRPHRGPGRPAGAGHHPHPARAARPAGRPVGHAGHDVPRVRAVAGRHVGVVRLRSPWAR